MSEQAWERLKQDGVTRRAMLRWSARMGVGAAGIALVGCGDDDDDAPAQQDEPEPTPTPRDDDQAEAEATADDEGAAAEAPGDDGATEDETPQMAQSIVVREVVLAGNAGSVLLANVSQEAVSLAGWFVCQRPSYWPLPDVEMAPGSELRLFAGAGEDGPDIYAGGGFGALGDSGEFALYRSAMFDDASQMVAYVGWGNGGGRVGVARQAGLWGDANVQASMGQVLRRGDGAAFAEAYTVADMPAAEMPPADEMPSEETPAGAVEVGGPNDFGPVVITRVYFDGNDMIELTNYGDADHSLDGYYLCQFPDYWPFPEGTAIPAGERLLINVGQGTSAPGLLFANGGAGSLNAAQGELGLYRSSGFGDPSEIASYLAWNGAGMRLGVAQEAGIFAEPIAVSEGDVVGYQGGGASDPARYAAVE